MKKFILDFTVIENRHLHDLYSLLILSPSDGHLPEIMPGQFVQVAVDNSKTTFLRRPISVNYVDKELGHLWLLVRKAGDGTSALLQKSAGDTVNLVLPLGNYFLLPASDEKVLLTGGGVGVAPMLYWGKVLRDNGFEPEFLLGARSAMDVLELEEFKKIGTVHISTEDGSLGEKGLVTTNSVLERKWDRIYCCGPAPMMKAVARVATSMGAQSKCLLKT